MHFKREVENSFGFLDSFLNAEASPIAELVCNMNESAKC